MILTFASCMSGQSRKEKTRVGGQGIAERITESMVSNAHVFRRLCSRSVTGSTAYLATESACHRM